MRYVAKNVRFICIALAILLVILQLVACDGNNDLAENTMVPTLTQKPTTAPTTTATTAPTQTPEQEVLTTLSFSDIPKDIDLAKYFIRPHQCAVSLADTETDGQVLALTSSSIMAAGTSDPYIYFKHAQLAKDLGYKSVNTQEYQYLVLRVRGAGLTGGIFSFYGYSTETPSGTGVTGQVDYRLQRTEDWQYLWINLSKYSKNLPLLRFDMENMAAENGEVLYIDSMAFFTDKDESLKYMPATTYPIKEQTADNYVAKIMSFNVQTENGTQVRADIRADMLRDLLDEYMPDSIGLQEVTTLWRGMMDNFIFNKSYASVGEPRTPGGEANPIYYRVDKYELIDSGTFWLSDTPDVSGSKFEGSQYVRICTWAHLRDLVTGNEFIHFNTHLDSLGGSDGRALRKQQIIVILKFLQRFGDLPMILTGDLNQAAVNSDGQKYSVYKTLTGIKKFTLDDGTEAFSPFSNARYDAPDNMPEGFCATMVASHNPNGTKYNPAKEPVDYVLYSPNSLTALSYKIRLYDRHGIYLSDHLPVICDIRFAPTAF